MLPVSNFKLVCEAQVLLVQPGGALALVLASAIIVPHKPTITRLVLNAKWQPAAVFSGRFVKPRKARKSQKKQTWFSSPLTFRGRQAAGRSFVEGGIGAFHDWCSLELNLSADGS